MMLKLYMCKGRNKQRAMKVVSRFPAGIASIAMDTRETKLVLTITGTVDIVAIIHKLRKICRTDILTAGPAKKPKKKKEEPKRDEAKEYKQIEEFYKAYYLAFDPYMRL